MTDSQSYRAKAFDDFAQAEKNESKAVELWAEATTLKATNDRRAKDAEAQDPEGIHPEVKKEDARIMAIAAEAGAYYMTAAIALANAEQSMRLAKLFFNR